MEFKNSINCIYPDFILILSLFISHHCALRLNSAFPQPASNFHSSIPQQCRTLTTQIKERLDKTMHWFVHLKHHLKLLGFSTSLLWVWATIKLLPGIVHLMNKAVCFQTVLPTPCRLENKQTWLVSMWGFLMHSLHAVRPPSHLRVANPHISLQSIPVKGLLTGLLNLGHPE